MIEYIFSILERIAKLVFLPVAMIFGNMEDVNNLIGEIFE